MRWCRSPDIVTLLLLAGAVAQHLWRGAERLALRAPLSLSLVLIQSLPHSVSVGLRVPADANELFVLVFLVIEEVCAGRDFLLVGCVKSTDPSISKEQRWLNI